MRRAERLNHVWSWDFVADRTDSGGRLRILSLIDEYSRECMALHVARKLTAHDLIEVMERLLAERGAPGHIRSDNGPEFIARILQDWLKQRQVKTLYMEPGSPWQNGHVESFNGSLRDECLDRELMLSVAEARALIEDYHRHYNQEAPLAASATAPQPKPDSSLRIPSSFYCKRPTECLIDNRFPLDRRES